MNKTFNPEMEIVVFDVEDVITTSAVGGDPVGNPDGDNELPLA